MKEADALAAYVAHLTARGWHVPPTPRGDFADVEATHPNGGRIFAEVKGLPGSKGTDVDTMYGQLLRRMSPEHPAGTRYVLVVPEALRWHVERVPAHVRERLRIGVLLVTTDRTVTPL